MEEEADGLPVHEELPGDVAGAAADEEGDAVDAPASEASCLNMNPMFKALPCMPVKAHAERTREVATADHAARVVPALLVCLYPQGARARADVGQGSCHEEGGD